MINNITNVDTHLQQQMSVGKAAQSRVSIPMPPVLSFKTPLRQEKATLRVKKFKRSDNIIITGEIDDHYVDIIEENVPIVGTTYNFFKAPPVTKKIKYLKNSYIIDYIQSPKVRCGLGTEALKGLAEKAFFDTRAEGRIVTYCAPVCEDASPAIFFYKLGFRFMDPSANDYMEECLIKKVPDIPVQKGMMYLPRKNIHKLLRYGDLF